MFQGHVGPLLRLRVRRVDHILSRYRVMCLYSRTLTNPPELSEAYEDDLNPFAFPNEESLSRNDLFLRGMECFDNFTWARTLHSYPPLCDYVNEKFLPNKAPGKPLHTLVFDLDETLITCYNEHPDYNSVYFTVGSTSE